MVFIVSRVRGSYSFAVLADPVILADAAIGILYILRGFKLLEAAAKIIQIKTRFSWC